ncbi:MAG: NADH:flavin oxidoreductase [Firmicutes bacterium]|nr:NADH:flavin oxidoreductase [Bacillota bacterium]MBO2521923.1 NADH:flavin oxidoreductase [Bacillota bacterium]
MASYPRVASFKDAAAFRQRLKELGVELPVEEEILPAPESPLAQELVVRGKKIGNRWCIQPMEGWDGTPDGMPSELTLRRWRRFGESGGKLIWGGEAVAVRHDGRANPNQLVISPKTKGGLSRLRETLVEAHKERYGTADDLMVGVQLTHSGRFSRPNRHDRLEPRIAYHHPILDRKFGIDPGDDSVVMSDAEVEDLIEDFVAAAKIARDVGFDFVDIKHCHGYLLHEFLGAHTRPGPYGGDFEGRTRLLREVVTAVRQACPDLIIGVRLSAFDLVPFRPDPEESHSGKLGRGIPEDYKDYLPYRYQFGIDPDDPTSYDLTETKKLLVLMKELGVDMVNVTAASPYYNPHLQRPALFPPSDGYQPPEDPLVGVARQANVVRELKAHVPGLPMVGSGLSYLQEFLPRVGQGLVREGWMDFVGMGRMTLAYPHLPGDTLSGRGMQRKLLCRTFSDCTTAPRNGMVSGCYPLDEFYKLRPEREKLAEIKKAL